MFLGFKFFLAFYNLFQCEEKRTDPYPEHGGQRSGGAGQRGAGGQAGEPWGINEQEERWNSEAGGPITPCLLYAPLPASLPALCQQAEEQARG